MSNKGNNIAFAKLLEYEQRSESFSPGSGAGSAREGAWNGVIFRLGDARLACNVDRIEEILPYPQATPVPGAKPWILGLANVRGSLLTVIDLAWYLTGERSPITAETRLLAGTLSKAPIGLMIDEVFGQRHFTDDAGTDCDLHPESPLGAIVGKQFKIGNEAWLELDLDRLFNAGEFQNGAAE
jgi:twitching motility protein PilI